MGLFRKSRPAKVPSYSLQEYKPVIRSSICTGEKVACMKNRETGKLHEIALIRSAEDLNTFCREYGIEDPSSLKTIY